MKNLTSKLFITSIISRPKASDSAITDILETSIIDLATEINKGNCFAFCGAGISFDPPSSLPGWGIFLEELLDRFCKQDKHPKLMAAEGHIRTLLSQSDFITAAEIIENSISIYQPYELADEVASIFERHDRTSGHYLSGGPPLPNSMHFLLTRFMFEKVLTTNYDDLLEKADEASGCKIYEVVDRSDPRLLDTKLAKGGNLLIHMHGRLSAKQTIVLTRGDYNKAYKKSYFNQWLIHNLISKSFLFIGFSLSDFDFVNLVRLAKDEVSADVKIGPHFAILPLSKYPDSHRHFLKERYDINVIPIDFNDAGQLHRFLVRLHGFSVKYAVEEIRYTRGNILNEMVSSFCKHTKRLFGTDYIMLGLVDRLDMQTLSIHYANSQTMNDVDIKPLPFDSELYKVYLQLRDINYYYNNECIKSIDELDLSVSGYFSSIPSSLLVIPIASQGKKVGILVLGSVLRDAFSRDHLDGLRNVSGRFADSYLAWLTRQNAISTVINSIRFDDLRTKLKSNVLVQSKHDMDFILYKINYADGTLTPFYSDVHLVRNKNVVWGPINITGNKHLATIALESGITLRFATVKNVLSDYGDIPSVKRGIDYFGIKNSGNLCVIPVRSFGYVACVLVAWTNSKPKNNKYHGTLFDRMKRLLRVYLNDYEAAKIHSTSTVADLALNKLHSSLSRIYGNTLSEYKKAIKVAHTCTIMIDECLEILVNNIVGFAKVRLWLKCKDSQFRLFKSRVHSNAVFNGLRQKDGYVNTDFDKLFCTNSKDVYTAFTIRRSSSDPYARPQSTQLFGGTPDPNSTSLHKDPSGLWITGPIIWGSRSYDDSVDTSTLLAFLSADSHFNQGGVPVNVIYDEMQLNFQRCFVDLITHILAPLCRNYISFPGIDQS